MVWADHLGLKCNSVCFLLALRLALLQRLDTRGREMGHLSKSPWSAPLGASYILLIYVGPEGTSSQSLWPLSLEGGTAEGPGGASVVREGLVGIPCTPIPPAPPDCSSHLPHLSKFQSLSGSWLLFSCLSSSLKAHLDGSPSLSFISSLNFLGQPATLGASMYLPFPLYPLPFGFRPHSTEITLSKVILVQVGAL